jgi:hypothetical protein
MTTLEGLLDTTASRRRPEAVTAALARSTAARALGSSAGTALLPLAVAAVGLSRSSAVIAGVLAVLVVAVHVSRRGPAATAAGERLPDEVSDWVPWVRAPSGVNRP